MTQSKFISKGIPTYINPNPDTMDEAGRRLDTNTVQRCTVGCEDSPANQNEGMQKVPEPEEEAPPVECVSNDDDVGEDPLKNFVPPTRPDFPICMIPMGMDNRYHTCCGVVTCNGCLHDSVRIDVDSSLGLERALQGFLQQNVPCPFCRVLQDTDNDTTMNQVKKRMESNDDNAVVMMGNALKYGLYGVHKNEQLAFEYYQRATELGNAEAPYIVSRYHFKGSFCDQDEDKAMEYLAIAASRGYYPAQSVLGSIEARNGNVDAAIYHFRIASKCGDETALEAVKAYYRSGFVKKDELASDLRAFWVSTNEMKSDAREMAKK